MWTNDEQRRWDVLSVLREWGYCDTVARYGYSIALLEQREREENGY